MRLIGLVAILNLSCLLVLANQKKPSDHFAFEQNNRLGRGVNVISDDPVWKNPLQARMLDKHFTMIKKAGFSNVRIVTKPLKFVLDTVEFKLDPTFFLTLDWAVNQALANKLMAIIDLHEHHAMSKNPLGYKAKFMAVWRQIAEHYKGYSQNVLFEVLNEPNMKSEVWNGIHNDALKIIRESNPQRTIIIGARNGNQIIFLKDLAIPENDRNIIVAIHYYEPLPFTHQGAKFSKTGKDLKDIPWNATESDKKSVTETFDMAVNWSKTKNRPITLGEFGSFENANMKDRINWSNFVAREAEKRNWSWSYWQFDTNFIVYDIDKDQWVKSILNALIPKN